MRLDAADLLHAPTRQYDVCIVGAGPAGIALAHSLSDMPLRVCVVESGGQSKTAFGDTLRRTESDGIDIKLDSRERVLGGTSTRWAGLSSPLDAIDFATRSWVPGSGWPIDRTELVPYYERASTLFRFPKWDHFGGIDWLPAAADRLPRWTGLEAKTFLAADPPQDFGTEFGGVFDGPHVDVVLRATVAGVDGRQGAAHATGVVIRLPDGSSASIDARVTVLAAGGIENARLLLVSRFGCAAGLGNDRDQVGRRFMNHPKATYGVIDLATAQGPLPGYFGFLYPGLGYAGYVGLRLTALEQERQSVLNSYVRFEPVFDWSDDPGVDALVRFVKARASFMRFFRTLKRDEVVELRSYAETGDDQDLPDGPARSGAMHRLREIVHHRRSVVRYLRARLTVAGGPLVTSIRLRNFMEMAPDPDNRVALSESLDALGSPIARVTHRCGDLDRRSLVALHRRLEREVAEAGWGRLRTGLSADLAPWPIRVDASHHLGATRMGADPSTSVVDKDLRLHTTDSVYVVGGSVFPTSGCANPTYTIVALALRLGDHLRQRLRAPA